MPYWRNWINVAAVSSHRPAFGANWPEKALTSSAYCADRNFTIMFAYVNVNVKR